MSVKNTETAEPDFIDLSLLDENLQLQEDGIEVEIVGPTNKPTGLVIVIVGPDSTTAQKASRDLVKEIEQEAAKEGNVDIDGPEAQRRRQITYLAKITKGWNKPPQVDGERLAFSEENVIRLYTKYPIIENQVRFKADRRGSFIKS
ncbi:hypothetical protein BAE36_04275 [Rhizobium leguminosarum bv. trifolii]|uniref:Uncharacterized protein n=1 Tax=Rhizobium leguminosarum bv. trifolii TaxID=386 RepID=A0A1B8RHY3_RHILT|nr:hypothetical protein [Rhizobium leguminosarum]AOO88626.1 hypothetical protein [Rhizobium leguminosarum bv. trifolii]OBY08333.1 hypothetical protein BAE36_04275 [Rhizobium leguminosarum bv. trifolii]